MHNKICDLRESLYWISPNGSKQALHAAAKNRHHHVFIFYGIYKLCDKIDERTVALCMCKRNLCDKMKMFHYCEEIWRNNRLKFCAIWCGKKKGKQILKLCFMHQHPNAIYGGAAAFCPLNYLFICCSCDRRFGSVIAFHWNELRRGLCSVSRVRLKFIYNEVTSLLNSA